MAQQKTFDPNEFGKKDNTFDPSEFESQQPDLSIPDNITTEKDTTEKVEKPKGWLHQVWETLNEPLTKAPSRFAQSVSQYVNPERTSSGIRGIGSAYIESLGDVLSSLTSPMNIALAATSGGAGLAAREGLPEAAKLLTYGTKAMSVPFAAHGAEQLINPESSLSERAMGGAELAGGILGMRSKIPEITAKSPIHPGPTFEDPGGLGWVQEELNKLKQGKYTTGERPSGPWESNTSAIEEGVKKTPEDKIYDIARQKHNMGMDLPENNAIPEFETQSKGKPFDPEEFKTQLEEAATGKKPDLMDEFQTSQSKGPVKSGEPFTDENGNVIGRTVDKNGSTGMEFTEEGKKRFEDIPTSEEEGFTKSKRYYSKDELNPKIPIEERQHLPPEEKSTLRKALEAPKGAMSIDLPFMTSAAFRQARPLSFTADWFKAWKTAAQAFGDSEAAEAIKNAHLENEYFKPRYQIVVSDSGKVKYVERPSFAEEVGLKTTDLLNNREEQIASNLTEKLPGYGRYVKASNRAYTAFLNDLRVNKFTDLMKAAEAMGKNDEFTARKIAKFVNDATGRGELSVKYSPNKMYNFEQGAKALGDILWSPRNLAAQIRFFNPMTYVNEDPMIRKEYVKGLARVIGSWGAFAGLAKIAGGKVSMDPTNADFGKLRIGNTRFDFGGGYSPLAVLMARGYTGVDTSSTTGKSRQLGKGFKPDTMGSITGDFLENRLSPAAKLAFDIYNATQQRPVKVLDRTAQMALPFYIGDIIQAAQEDPYVAALVAPASSIGIGVQSYGNKRGDFNKSVYIPESADFKINSPHPGRLF